MVYIHKFPFLCPSDGFWDTLWLLVRLGGPYETLEIEPRLAMCRARAPLTVLLLWASTGQSGSTLRAEPRNTVTVGMDGEEAGMELMTNRESRPPCH